MTTPNPLFPNASKSFLALNKGIGERPKHEFTEADKQAATDLCDMAQHKGKEKELQKLCQNELTRRGVRFYLHLSPMAREKEGLPDLIFGWNFGNKHYSLLPCAVELKVKGGRVSEKQKEVMADMEKDGWRVAVCWSYEQFVKFLEGA